MLCIQYSCGIELIGQAVCSGLARGFAIQGLDTFWRSYPLGEAARQENQRSSLERGGLARSAVRFANGHLNDDKTVVKMGHPAFGASQENWQALLESGCKRQI